MVESAIDQEEGEFACRVLAHLREGDHNDDQHDDRDRVTMRHTRPASRTRGRRCSARAPFP